MIYTAVFLLLTGAMVTAAATATDPRAANRLTRQSGLLLLALICLGLALWLVFPSGPWFLPAALSINGAACVAHGISLNNRLHLLGGFLFSILGGFQLGLVLIQSMMIR
jgi:hypothetical protein